MEENIVRSVILKCFRSMLKSLQSNDVAQACKKSSYLKYLVVTHVHQLHVRFKVDFVSTFLQHVGVRNNAPQSVPEDLSSMLRALTEDCCSQLPEETVISLMREIKTALTTSGGILTNYHRNLLGILTNLLDTNWKYHKEVIVSLECILYPLYCIVSKKCNDVSIIAEIVNVVYVLLAPPINNNVKVTISQRVIPLVVEQLNEWAANCSTSEKDVYIMQNLLHLCIVSMSNSAQCQDIFLQSGGIDVLVRVLVKTELMEELMNLHLKEQHFKDCAKSLYASILCVLDTAVSHNRKVCQKVDNLQVLSILKKYISKTPADQLGILVTCCVHILEGGIDCPDSNMLIQLYDKAHALLNKNDMFISSESISFLAKIIQKSVTGKPSKKLGTPHHRLFQKAKLRLTASKTDKVRLPKSPKHEAYVADKTELNPENCTQLSVTQPTKIKFCHVTRAELVIFMNCIRINGINMKAVRNAYPFHKYMTEEDLYCLWRAMWNKK